MCTPLFGTSISTFSRGHQPAFAGINTFLKSPYLEDVHEVGRHEVAIVGVPFDMGTTYRPGARFGPQAIRRISALYDSYCLDLAVDLQEELDVVDLGDVFVIPSYEDEAPARRGEHVRGDAEVRENYVRLHRGPH